MTKNKTRPGAGSVKAFVEGIANEGRRDDCRALVKLMKRVTGCSPKMWGSSIVGFGSYHYKYASGREGDFFLTGFSPRKQALVVYLISGFKRHAALMKKLGRHKTGKSCLYVRRLEDLDGKVLEQLLAESVAYMKKTYPTGK